MIPTPESIEAKLHGLTEIKTPGASIASGDIPIPAEFMGDFDEGLLNEIPAADLPGTDEKTTDPKTGAPTVKFDGTGLVDQGVRMADNVLQMGFDWMDKATTLYKEDRQALSFLLASTRKGKTQQLDEYDQWLIAQGDILQERSDRRAMTEEERKNITEALKAMPWIKDRVMTPEKALMWTLIMYFGVRMVPIGLNMMGGKAVPPMIATTEQEPIERAAPQPIVKMQTQQTVTPATIIHKEMPPEPFPEADKF